MRRDDDTERDVKAELQWRIGANSIAVAVKDGVVTLTGVVPSVYQRWDAESAAKCIAGVREVVSDLSVQLRDTDVRPDPDVLSDVQATLRARLPTAGANIRVSVRDGWVTLEGEVEWNYQRERAEEAIRMSGPGIKGLSNLLQIKPKTAPIDIKRRIEDALQRNVELAPQHITVVANGSEVTLSGTVRCWAECQAADRTAWCAPGVTTVDNRITVNPPSGASAVKTETGVA